MSTTSNISQIPQPVLQMAVKKSPQHDTKLAHVLKAMLQSENLVDVTIDCAGGQVNAHRLVLAASSIYFRDLFSRMFDGRCPQLYRPIIVLRDLPIDDVKIMLEIIYGGEVVIPQRRVGSLMSVAEYLQIDVMAIPPSTQPSY